MNSSSLSGWDEWGPDLFVDEIASISVGLNLEANVVLDVACSVGEGFMLMSFLKVLLCCG